MTIKRDILGTVVEIKLTEQELAMAHVSYLQHEIVKAQTAQTAKHEPCMERDYKSGLYKCRDEIAKHKTRHYTIGQIIDEYIDDLCSAYRNGMSTNQIANTVGVSKLTVTRHLVKAGIEIRPKFAVMYASYVA